MKIILFYLLLLAIIAIPVISIQFMKHQAATKIQHVLPSPTLHDSSGKAITEAEKEIAKQVTSFSNRKYLYSIKFAGNAEITSGDQGSYATDYFLGGCLAVTAVPHSLVNASFDKKIRFPLSQIKKMQQLNEGESWNVPNGYNYDKVVGIDSYTKKPNYWLGLQEATVFEWSNNWEMLGNVRYFYTQHGKYDYLVVARYNDDYCQNAKSLEAISGFEFLSQD